MSKDFDTWNSLKKVTNERLKYVVFSEREIWWCQLGLNIGDEEDGKNESFERPVLVLRKFNKHIAVILPLTTQGKSNLPFYYKINVLKGNSFVILSQLRLISSRRFLRKMRRLGRGEFSIIKKKVTALILNVESPE